MEKYQVESTEINDDEIEIDLAILFGDMWKGIKRFWWLLLLFIALAASIAVYFSVRIYTPKYRAAATFSVAVNTQNSSAYDEEDSYGFTYKKSITSQMADTFPYILQSNVLQNIVANELGVEQLNGTISIESYTDSNLFRLMVDSDNAQDAYNILQSVVSNYPQIATFVIGDTKLNIIESPSLPSTPENPLSIQKNVLIGCGIGLLFGLIVMFIYAVSRKTIRTVEDFKKKTNVSCVGTIPKVVFKKRNKGIDQSITLQNRKVGMAFEESMRSITNRVLRSLEKKEQKVVLVTSTLPNEGKTICSVNLAYSLAQRKKKVLLIDADLRNPTITDMPGAETVKNEGLAEVLQGKITIKDALIKVEKVPMYLIAGSEGYSRPTRLLVKSGLNELLNTLKETFDYVIIDTPPNAIVSDASIIAQYADAAVYVVRQDYVNEGRFIESLESLVDSGVDIIGCVLNGVESGVSGYGYGYGKYGRYGRYGKYGQYGKYSKYGYGHTEK